VLAFSKRAVELKFCLFGVKGVVADTLTIGVYFKEASDNIDSLLISSFL